MHYFSFFLFILSSGFFFYLSSEWSWGCGCKKKPSTGSAIQSVQLITCTQETVQAPAHVPSFSPYVSEHTRFCCDPKPRTLANGASSSPYAFPLDAMLRLPACSQCFTPEVCLGNPSPEIGGSAASISATAALTQAANLTGGIAAASVGLGNNVGGAPSTSDLAATLGGSSLQEVPPALRSSSQPPSLAPGVDPSLGLGGARPSLLTSASGGFAPLNSSTQGGGGVENAIGPWDLSGSEGEQQGGGEKSEPLSQANPPPAEGQKGTLNGGGTSGAAVGGALGGAGRVGSGTRSPSAVRGSTTSMDSGGPSLRETTLNRNRGGEGTSGNLLMGESQQAALEFVRQGAVEEGNASVVLLTPDPEDYFTRIDIESSLFQRVHLRYQTEKLQK